MSDTARKLTALFSLVWLLWSIASMAAQSAPEVETYPEALPATEAAPDGGQPVQSEERVADWIPVGAVAPEVERRAIESRARLASPDPFAQRAALAMIRRDAERFDVREMRIAAVPLVIDLLGNEYTILEFPVDVRIDVSTRVEALELLGVLGGERARSQIRDSVLVDRDPVVRVQAAQILARRLGDDPDSDLAVVARSLRESVDGRGDEAEIARMLGVVTTLVERAWEPATRDLLEALVAIVGGPYSSSSRREALDLLESLAER